MNQAKLIKSGRSILKFLKKKLPGILVTAGLISSTGAVVKAIRVTPEAVEKIHEDSRKAHDGDPYAYTKLEAVQSAWKIYIPVALLWGSSMAELIAAFTIQSKRYASLSAAAALYDASMREYKKQVREEVGVEKEKDISRKALANHAANHDFSDDVRFGDGDEWFVDSITGQLFKTTRRDIELACNRLNMALRRENSLNYNRFCCEFDDLVTTPAGEKLGWNIDYVRDGIEPRFIPNEKNGRLVWTLEFEVPPDTDYD